MPLDPSLRDELVAMATGELAAADAFFAAVERDAALASELDRLLADPSTPLIGVLPGWEAAPPEAEPLLSANAANARRLAEIVEADGWPGLRRVGADGADAAWLVAQHADLANEVRRGWLPALAEAVARGEADPWHLATLTDRVAAVARQPQLFGTIAILAPDGEVEHPVPVRDAGELDRRREEIGLPPAGAEVPYLARGDLVPYGPDRADIPLLQWPMVLEGHVSVEAALVAAIRPLHRVWAVRPGDRRLGRLRALARERGVTIDPVEPEIVDELAAGRTHGGVIALVGPRRPHSVQHLLAEVGEGSLVVMLDGVEDPFNFGQAVRSLYAAGVDGLVVRRSWETALATVTRASGGATELMPTGIAATPDEAAETARRAGMRVACAVADPEAPELGDVDLRGGLFVLIGGERRGITRSFVERADLRLRIGYGRADAPALGAASAAAVVGFEALRQRGQRAG